MSISGVAYFAIRTDMVPDLPPELMEQFRLYFFGGTMIAWIISGVFSVLFLFIKSGLRFLFLLMPAAIPIMYALYVLNFFNP